MMERGADDGGVNYGEEGRPEEEGRRIACARSWGMGRFLRRPEERREGR
jgi:hypothetical protein